MAVTEIAMQVGWKSIGTFGRTDQVCVQVSHTTCLCDVSFVRYAAPFGERHPNIQVRARFTSCRKPNAPRARSRR
jgi:hypothetical protein